MDTVLGIIILIVLFVGPFRLLGALFGATKEAVAPNAGRPRMQPIEARVRHIPAAGADGLPDHYLVETRGVTAVSPSRELVAIAMLDDTTDGTSEPLPVLSLLDWQQASSSPIFFDKTKIGVWNGHVFGTEDWTSLEIRIFPQVLRAPYSGTRTMRVRVQIYDDASSSDLAFWSTDLTLTCDLDEVGWMEQSERREVSERCAIRMAMSVAVATDGIDAAEKSVIRSWAKDQLDYVADAYRQERKAELNRILIEAIEDANSGEIDLGAEIQRLRDNGTQGGRLEAVELCIAVMGADGRADHEELEQVNKIAKKLEVDDVWFAQLRDKAVSAIAVSSEGSAEELAAVLGIDLSQDQATIRAQLNAAFDRWSSRSTSVSDPDKRAEAERMLDVVAEARTKLLN